MKKIIVILLAVFIVMPFFTGNARGDTEVLVNVKPALRNSLAEYDISFITIKDLIGGKDDIFVQFPEGTQLPCSCPHNWTLDHFTINGYKPARAGKMNDIPNTIYLVMPGGITIKAGSNVNVVIKDSANIWNPGKPGKYQLTIWTTKEGKVKSNFYEITSTHLTDVSIYVTPETAGLIASYKIYFTTGEKGELFNGQRIYIEFPKGTGFPKTVNKNKILVNEKIAEDAEVRNRVLSIVLSHSINSKRKCLIQINGDFGISNPKDSGTKSLYVWTENEPEKIKADFTIKAQSIVSTLVSTEPAAPDGMSGFFKTAPTITLKAETNTNSKTETFYKIDDEGYKKYATPFAMPEGIHTLYYYSKAGNLEETPREMGFKVDTTVPGISVEFPGKTPFYTGDKTINIFGKVSEKGQLVVNGKVVLLRKDLSFSTVLKLTPGKNIIMLHFTDVAGNATSKEIKVFFDTTVPQISIASPSDWEEILTEEITVKGSVSPANSEVCINGGKVNVSADGSFTYSFIPESNGNLIPVKVKAMYPYSKKSVTKVIIVVYKPSLPGVLLTVNSHSALVNGKKKEMDAAPFIDKHSNRTLVPVRFVAEFLGGKVSWDPKTRTVIVQLNGREVKLKIGSNTAYVNSAAVSLDQPPIIKENRAFIPLRFVMETFGFKVVWDASVKTITITAP